MRISRRIKIFIIFLIVVVGGYLLAGYFNQQWSSIPAEFYDARVQGALIAQNIVSLSNRAVADLSRINELEKQGRFTDAILLTSQVVGQSQEIRNQAVALSGEIEKMTHSLSAIKSLEARQAVLEAITHRLALISRLINYSGALSQLLDILREHFAGRPTSQSVTGLLAQIDAEVRAINNFNAQAALAMERFDRLVR